MVARFPGVEELVAQARAETGLVDFGGESHLPALTALADALAREADLNETGIALQQSRIVELLKNRLRLQVFLQRWPEIEDEVVAPPVLILGLPRTGTTMLQRLLSTDRRFIATRWYEVRFPVPELEWNFVDAQDVRIEVARAEVAALVAANPELLSIHPLDAEAPDEDLMLLEGSFLSTVPTSQAHIPSYDAYYARDDARHATREHRRLLQFLQWQRRRAGHAVDGKRWLLKAPAHMYILDAMLETYPGARFITSHRDPLACIPSISSFYFETWQIYSDSANAAACGRDAARFWGAALDRLVAAARRRPEQFLDIEYADLMERQDDAIERIYGFLGLAIEPETRAGFARWRSENRRDRRRPHHYRIEDFGLTRDALAEAFADYRRARGYVLNPGAKRA